ncbi:RNA-binding family protein [Quillaja saponaria]|uniref:RNA-binding family protein n=1 Tax=Quillaja saponaria TaxID=32244 RepID=A0AAD7P8J9_QUISA|nr:RNA-binding family protein [Quillaja saponaria]
MESTMKTEDLLAQYGTVSKLNPLTAPKLVHLFSREELMELLWISILRHLDFIDTLYSSADRDPTKRLLLVCDLNFSTTSETLRFSFSSYGPVERAVVAYDKKTGKSRSYGFVTFRNIDAALMILLSPTMEIDGRLVKIKLSNPRDSGSSSIADNKGKSLFVFLVFSFFLLLV